MPDQQNVDLARMRQEYEVAGLRRRSLSADPLDQFERWFAAAVAADVGEPNAMVLSTIDHAGMPRSRYVLLKGVSEGGFEFYTNYESDKGRQLAATPQAALTFGWLALHRQVNVSGDVSRLPPTVSDEYFSLRPRDSQLGAWASAQSQPLMGRDDLEAEFERVVDRFAGQDVPRPPHWGGYRLLPRTFEFWQGRANRLHDRFVYERDAEGWSIERRSP